MAEGIKIVRKLLFYALQFSSPYFPFPPSQPLAETGNPAEKNTNEFRLISFGGLEEGFEFFFFPALFVGVYGSVDLTVYIRGV